MKFDYIDHSSVKTQWRRCEKYEKKKEKKFLQAMWGWGKSIEALFERLCVYVCVL